MSFTAIIGLCVTALAFIVMLRGYRPEYALLASICLSCILLIFGIAKSAEIVDCVKELSGKSGIDGQNISLMFKALGVCYLTGIAKDICTDCGQTALGDRVDFIGKITITALSIPLIIEVLSLITDLL